MMTAALWTVAVFAVILWAWGLSIRLGADNSDADALAIVVSVPVFVAAAISTALWICLAALHWNWVR